MIAFDEKRNSRAMKRDGQHVCGDGVSPANGLLSR